MNKTKRLCALLVVLAVLCIAAFAVNGYEEKKEAIQNSGQVILEIPTDSVTALSWINESGTYSFTKGDTWVYDADNAFPVDEDKINDLLSQFNAFTAAFSIEDVEDYGQYGLDAPVCTITVTTEDAAYTVKLGDFSKMDEQRYVSIGDGKAYLALQDPLEEFDAVLEDMILDDTIPEFDQAEEITFTGSENYTITRDEEAKSICAKDVYFTDGKPLDTDKVKSLVSSIQSLSLTDFASYNVSDAELTDFGLASPDLTIGIAYSTLDEDGQKVDSGRFQLALSRNAEEYDAYLKAVDEDEEELPEVSCYARLDESQIVYRISLDDYEKLTAVSYDTLRHQKLFTGDFDTVTSIDAVVSGETCTFTYTPPEDEDADEDGTWYYGEESFDIYSLKTALTALSAAEFTSEKPTGQEEISLTVHLDNEDFPTFTLTLYRLDGTHCLAAVDGKTVALVTRSQTVNLVEAVNALTLGS